MKTAGRSSSDSLEGNGGKVRRTGQYGKGFMRKKQKMAHYAVVPKSAQKLGNVYGNFEIVAQGNVLWSTPKGARHESLHPFTLRYKTKSGKWKTLESKPIC